ncbi:MAG: OmpH family outer membrane protein [Flavobacteriales bacterium]
MKRIIAIAALICITATAGIAQKFGHINGQNLVKHMPEYKVAEAEIDTLIMQYQQVLKELKADYDALVDKVKAQQASNPATPKAIIEKNMVKLQGMEQEIYETQELMNSDVQEKQAEKLAPIERKALNAVQEVAKEKGFTYIFDTSAGVLLFIDGGIDITPLVCTKLGIPDYSPEEKAEMEKLKNGDKTDPVVPPTPPVEKN